MAQLLTSRPATPARRKGLRAAGALAALVVGATIAPVAGASSAEAVTAPAATAYCGTPLEATLFAGQTTDAGSVTIANDATNLYITFATDSPWVMNQTHLQVADTRESIPQTKQGNPKIGNFAHQTTHSPAVSTYTYTLPKAEADLDGNQSVVVAAHAALSKLGADGTTVIGTETGWSAGKTFVERGSWATYTEYIWQDCVKDAPVETATETAFAKDTTGLSTCFLDLDLNNDGKGDFNRWGWTNGALTEGDYSFELYAGAGQCNTGKGTDVGKVDVAYHDGSATVTITTQGANPTTGQPYTMADAQVYIGNAMLPSNNSEFTVAPGQYPQVRSEANNTTVQEFTFSGLSGSVYVVAHTSVAGFPLPAAK